MKKIIAITFALILAFSLSSCSKKETPKSESSKITSSAPEKEASTVEAELIEDVNEVKGDVILVTEPKSNKNNLASVVFKATGKVTDFRFFRMVYHTDGIFEAGEGMYSTNEFPLDKSIVIKMEFQGSIPAHAISFTDSNGKMRRFYLSLSGKDGSLIFEEFERFSDIL